MRLSQKSAVNADDKSGGHDDTVTASPVERKVLLTALAHDGRWICKAVAVQYEPLSLMPTAAMEGRKKQPVGLKLNVWQPQTLVCARKNWNCSVYLRIIRVGVGEDGWVG